MAFLDNWRLCCPKFNWRLLLWIPCFFDPDTYLIHIFFDSLLFFTFLAFFTIYLIISYTSSLCSDPILTSLASSPTYRRSKTDKPLCSRWNTNETKKQDLQYSPETGDLPTNPPAHKIHSSEETSPRSSSALCHILAYILLILLTYIASCIVFCHFRAKSSSDEEDFRTIVTLAPDLGGPFQILEPALAVFRCK